MEEPAASTRARNAHVPNRCPDSAAVTHDDDTPDANATAAPPSRRSPAPKPQATAPRSLQHCFQLQASTAPPAHRQAFHQATPGPHHHATARRGSARQHSGYSSVDHSAPQQRHAATPFAPPPRATHAPAHGPTQRVHPLHAPPHQSNTHTTCRADARATAYATPRPAARVPAPA